MKVIFSQFGVDFDGKVDDSEAFAFIERNSVKIRLSARAGVLRAYADIFRKIAELNAAAAPKARNSKMAAEKRAATILLFSGIERPLTYSVPESLESLAVGSLVSVPLRGGSACGIVTDIRPAAEVGQLSFKLRPLRSFVQPEPVLTPELMKLAKWMGEYYGCGMRQIFETMIPAVVRAGKGAREAAEISLARPVSPEEIDALLPRAPQQRKLLEFMGGYPDAILKSALIRLAQTTSAAIDALVKKGCSSRARGKSGAGRSTTIYRRRKPSHPSRRSSTPSSKRPSGKSHPTSPRAPSKRDCSTA